MSTEQPVELMVPIKAAPGKEAELRKELHAMLEPTRVEKGCLFYRLYESQVPGQFFFHELWSNQAALDSHAASAHLKRMAERTRDLVATPIVVHDVKDIV